MFVPAALAEILNLWELRSTAVDVLVFERALLFDVQTRQFADCV